MSFISTMEARLPPGFRFHPRDDELVLDYLSHKLSGSGLDRIFGHAIMIDVDLNKCEPWDLPETARVGGKEWYFFSLRDRKYATGERTNRATQSGYWKATGKDRAVSRRGVVVGMRKTLVFYQGRAPKGRKTDWVMHEFRLEEGGGGADHHHHHHHHHPPKFPFIKGDWVLCRVLNKSKGLMTSRSVTQTWHNVDSSSNPPPLPPLVDTFTAFDRAAPSLEGHEQVPCFSNSPLLSRRANNTGGIFDILSRDKNTMKGAVNHLTRLQSASNSNLNSNPNPNSNLAQGHLESYLVEHGLSHMLNTFSASM